ncbi:MAG: acyl-CoA dehydrogenase [Nitrososphaeria archaeon]|nr:acyl-CoA dehydrogenase [Nitrososphaeria archaeon]NIN52923.1 acyl-CoA dehydrogenase [Nitrososphaeria archaeon]NIQ33482.1 acyl-CoA dehydrogenase [Nitrososphaeria archaeon]
MEFELTTEQVDIKTAAREFCEREFTREIAMEHDREEKFPAELYRKAAGLGFIGIHFPEEYGGGGFGTLENILVVEEMCRVDSSLGAAVMLGGFACELIMRHGTEEEKARYLPKVARGEYISAGAFTEPAHGSDLTRLDTAAVKDGDEWVVNGTKTLITNAPVADFFIVLCQTELEAAPPYRGQSLFVIDKGTPGLDVTKIGDKLGIRPSLTGEVSLSDVHVSGENLVGEFNRGFYHSLSFFDESRAMVAAQAVGTAQGVFERALSYAREREAFGRRITEFQAVSHKLADMAIKIEAARLLTYKASWLIDQGKMDPVMTSIAKTYAGRAAVEVADEAVQILGGYGYIAEYEVERFYRDAKITEIYEGTREIQKNTIVRSLLRR